MSQPVRIMAKDLDGVLLSRKDERDQSNGMITPKVPRPAAKKARTANDRPGTKQAAAPAWHMALQHYCDEKVVCKDKCGTLRWDATRPGLVVELADAQHVSLSQFENWCGSKANNAGRSIKFESTNESLISTAKEKSLNSQAKDNAPTAPTTVFLSAEIRNPEAHGHMKTLEEKSMASYLTAISEGAVQTHLTGAVQLDACSPTLEHVKVEPQAVQQLVPTHESCSTHSVVGTQLETTLKHAPSVADRSEIDASSKGAREAAAPQAVKEPSASEIMDIDGEQEAGVSGLNYKQPELPAFAQPVDEMPVEYTNQDLIRYLLSWHTQV